MARCRHWDQLPDCGHWVDRILNTGRSAVVNAIWLSAAPVRLKGSATCGRNFEAQFHDFYRRSADIRRISYCCRQSNATQQGKRSFVFSVSVALKLSQGQPNEVLAHCLTNLRQARLCLGRHIAATLELPTIAHPTQTDKKALCSTKIWPSV
jgi:hypothetical protein